MATKPLCRQWPNCKFGDKCAFGHPSPSGSTIAPKQQSGSSSAALEGDVTSLTPGQRAALILSQRKAALLASQNEGGASATAMTTSTSTPTPTSTSTAPTIGGTVLSATAPAFVSTGAFTLPPRRPQSQSGSSTAPPASSQQVAVASSTSIGTASVSPAVSASSFHSGSAQAAASGPPPAGVSGAGGASGGAAKGNVQPCRFGRECTRSNCYFSHPDGCVVGASLIATAFEQSTQPYFPLEEGLALARKAVTEIASANQRTTLQYIGLPDAATILRTIAATAAATAASSTTSLSLSAAPDTPNVCSDPAYCKATGKRFIVEKVDNKFVLRAERWYPDADDAIQSSSSSSSSSFSSSSSSFAGVREPLLLYPVAFVRSSTGPLDPNKAMEALGTDATASSPGDANNSNADATASADASDGVNKRTRTPAIEGAYGSGSSKADGDADSNSESKRPPSPVPTPADYYQPFLDITVASTFKFPSKLPPQYAYLSEYVKTGSASAFSSSTSTSTSGSSRPQSRSFGMPGGMAEVAVLSRAGPSAASATAGDEDEEVVYDSAKGYFRSKQKPPPRGTFDPYVIRCMEIRDDNKGHALLRNMGWESQGGLGRFSEGVAAPPAISIRPERLGIGFTINNNY